MDYIYILEALTLSITFILIFCFMSNKRTHRALPIEWPFLGMIPSLLVESHHLWDWGIEVLEANNLTFLFKGPWFGGIDMLVTVDPANIHHILSSNFNNYAKGSVYRERFDGLGDGILNTEAELWKYLRRSAQNMIHHERFQRFFLTTNMSKLETGLVPLLDHFANEKTVVDLKDVFQRFTSDTTFILVTGHDPRLLSVEMPEFEFFKALEEAEEAIFYRFLKPRILWKLQNRFGLGEERNLRRAVGIMDSIIEEHISAKRDEIRLGVRSKEEAREDLLTSYMNLFATKDGGMNDKFLRDNILNLITAGTDTASLALTWLFWLLSKNPESVAKIREEINTNLPRTKTRDRDGSPYDLTSLKKLAYLNGALCEALRLYPPVPFLMRSPPKPDVLPSGHRIDGNTNVLIPVFALGRMKSIWGEDATDFKPERWISESGEAKYEPSSKFLAFNAGPRTCLGKEMAITQMKALAAEIIQNYDIEVVEGQKVEPVPSVILHMKHGLRVLVTKRSCSA